MATKTITLELDAYDKLKSAKRGSESFSSVVRRSILPASPRTGKEMLDHLRTRPATLSDKDLTAIEEISTNDTPPTNPWDE